MFGRGGGLPRAVGGFERVRRFWDPNQQLLVAKIQPGEYCVTRGGEWLITLLGSCVSACVRDPVAGVGGMNHFMLPDLLRPGRWGRTRVNRAHRYGTYAMEHMINDVLKLGARRDRLELKLVGGARVLESDTSVGERNIDFVREYLAREGLRARSEDLGGVHARRVYYDIESGR
ncbi:MAG: chemoreceptor glutamine deamidase CheD, partial [Pseudomonadota bacterium]